LEHLSLDPERIPQHVAIIMDGNGRWAKRKGLPRIMGHEYGVRAVREITEAAAEKGVKFLTLYTFSKENWNRPALEITGLMKLLVRTIRKEIKTLQDQDIRLQTIGDKSALPGPVLKELDEAILSTQHNKRMTLVLALNYSARWDLAQAANQLASQVAKGAIDPQTVDEACFASFLSTHFLPDPELIIRTSGEYRISNFLLWEAAYAEFFFTPVFWPDFNKEAFHLALLDFQSRERRFGKISEQLHEK
jgi:undecaprenyl diphosphate synthase